MKKLIQLIKKNAGETNFSGVVSINQSGEDVYSEAFGYRDAINKIPNKKNTIFGTASGTKLFTALGIGVLIDEKKISLDTCVGDINNDYSGFISPKATIKNLLNHTSGIYDYYDEEIITDFDNFYVDIPWYKLETPLDYFPLFKDKTKKFNPDDRHSYSNGGYIFLGIIIEFITKRLFRDFIEEKILSPSKMNNSGFFSFDNLPSNTANGYLADGLRTNIYNLPKRGASDGGMFTTATDMTAFWRALFSHKIISEQLLKDFCTKQIKFNDVVGYGLGVYISKIEDYDIFFTSGSDAGVGFDSSYIPKTDIVISICSNITDGEGIIRNTIYDNIEI